MRKWTAFGLALLCCCLLAAAGSAELLGCRTHAGELDEAGRLSLAGCGEHGETLPNGMSGVRQAVVWDHATAVLHENGQVTLWGDHGFDTAEVSGWRNVRQIQADEDCLLAVTAEGRLRAVWSERILREAAEDSEDLRYTWVKALENQWVVRLAAAPDWRTMTVAMLADGEVWIPQYMEPQVIRPESRVDWTAYRKVIVSHGGTLFALDEGGRLFRLTADGKWACIAAQVADIAAGSEMLCILTVDGGLRFAKADEASIAWRDHLYDPWDGTPLPDWEHADEISLMVGGDYVVVRCGDTLAAEGTLGETDALPAVRAQLEGPSPLVETAQNGSYLILRHMDGTLQTMRVDGGMYAFSTFGAEDARSRALRFEEAGGPERQILLRDLRMRVSWPYAVRSDGRVIALEDGGIPEVLNWDGVRGIAAEGDLVLAVLEDGRVRTAWRGEDPGLAGLAQEAALWTDMAEVVLYHRVIAGVTRDGRVRLAGAVKAEPDWRQWREVVSVVMTGGIHSGDWHEEVHLVGLRADGTVLGELCGTDQVVSLSGCNRVIAATRLDGSVTVQGWNFLGDCMTGSLHGVRYLAFSDEFYTPAYLIGPDGRVYEPGNFPEQTVEGFENLTDVAMLIPVNDWDNRWLALCSDGSLHDQDGIVWMLEK